MAAQDNETKKGVVKTFGLTNLALNNKNTVFFLTIMIAILGVSTYVSLPKDSYPEVELPTVYIGTAYPGNAPLDMENLVTRPIEKELNTITEIDEIRSTSVQGYSTIIAEFITDTDIDDALQKAKDAVDKAKQELPDDLPADPNVFEMDFSEFPILNINLSGDYSMEELEEYAEDLEDEIEKIPEVSKVEITGVEEKEVQIWADPFKMEARKVSFGDIESAVAQENVTLSGGDVLTDGVRRSIRVIGEFTEPQQLEEVVVKDENGDIVYLKDVAEVEFDYAEKSSYARLAKKPVVSVDVIKRSGENLLIVTDKINEVLDDAKKRLPQDINIAITNDQSEMTRQMVSSLENNIISGVILVVLVLLFFLGSRNALFVGVAIPLSMFIAFNVIGLLDYTVNMMILFSLIMALGMLVDNGIVVVENVYRKMEEGFKPLQAAKEGVGEVAMPIIASTATTLAAFLPLMLWPGMMGQFMSLLPLGLIITLSSSLFVALVINPVLISTFMKVQKGRPKINEKRLWITIAALIIAGVGLVLAGVMALGNLLLALALIIILSTYVLTPLSLKFQASFLPWLENYYSNFLKFALGGWRPYLFFGGTVLTMVLSFVLMGIFPPNVLFFPENKPKYINVFVEFPVGVDIKTTNEFTEKIEDDVLNMMDKYGDVVESVITKVGEDTSDPNDPSSVGRSETPHQSRITINFVEFKERYTDDGEFVDTGEVLAEVRNEVGNYPGVTVTVDKDQAGPPVGKPINIEITGPEFEELIDIADDMKKFINESGIEGIEKLKADLETGKPELLVSIDRDNARRFGLSTSQIASEIRTALFGKEVSEFKQGEDEYEIQLRLADKYRYSVDALMNKQITFRNPKGKILQIPISSVAEAKLSSTYSSVKRKDLDRMVTLSSNVLTGYNATAVNDQIKAELADFELPYGYSFKFGGEQEEQAKEMAFLSEAFMLAVALIFIIIVSQFNKITTPFIIMTSVVLSTTGVFIGMVIFNMDFVVIMTMLGIISLAGIVVNNAIVLIDFIELMRERRKQEAGVDKLPMDQIILAIRDAGKTRLRPVILTAITTVLGLIPLAIGINIDFIGFFNSYDADFYMGGDNVIFWGPMSWTIIFGLIFATFLTLVIVPVMYLFFAKINRKLGVS